MRWVVVWVLLVTGGVHADVFVVRHAEKLTTAPGAMTESDLGELRAVGLSDKDILDLTLVTSYFNFVNRIALGLGVTFSAEEMSGYIDEGD